MLRSKKFVIGLLLIVLVGCSSQTQTVYVTKTGDKYHADDCQFLSKSKIEIEKDDAIAQGYTACIRCRP